MILSGVTVSTVLWANPSNPYVWIVLGVTLAFGLVGFYDDYLKVTKQTHGGFAGRLRLIIEGLVAVGACWALMQSRTAAVRDLADVSVLQGAGLQSELVLPPVRRVHHRRRRQCREPDRRARRSRDRPGDDRGRLLRRVLLCGRQRVPDRLSAASLRARHRRACDPVRGRDRRRARVSLVQRAAGLDLHGRHRLARARRAARLDRGRDQARAGARDRRRAVRARSRVGDRAGGLVQAHRQARVPHGAAASSLRAEGLDRAADRDPVLDHLDRAGAARASRR